MTELQDAINVQRFLKENTAHSKEVLEQCEEVLKVLHANGFVHCDLRPVNILILSISIGPGRATDGCLIKTEHDIYWIKNW